MNFLKNTFNKLFSKPQETANNPQQPQTNPPQSESEDDIPEDALKELFELTSQLISVSTKPAPDSYKLRLYGFFKQAKVGDCNVDKPAIYEFAAKAKWEAWNSLKGMTPIEAMKNYIATAVQIDPEISKRMSAIFHADEKEYGQMMPQMMMMDDQKEGAAMKMVEQKDYSDSYVHPYFKSIEKGEPLNQITKELLLKKNNSPAVYPLHFAIDKEREDLVPKFLQLLTVEEIQEMKDEQGTGILEYAQLIENESILAAVRAKLGK